jgi:hypothetical protein
MTGQEANKQLAQRLIELTTTEEHGEFYETGGDFLPLSVWATMGYDPEMIKNGSLPKDKKLHPVLGDTFRVCVLRSGHRGSKKVEKSDKLVASLPGSSGDNSQPALGAPPVPLALTDKSSDSDSDTSSSSGRKKSKKSKKAAKKLKKAERKLKRKRGSSPQKASLSSS